MFPTQPWNFRIFAEAPAAFHEWMRSLQTSCGKIWRREITTRARNISAS